MSVLTSIAMRSHSCSGVDSSWDCCVVDCVLFETLINRLLVSVLTSIARRSHPCSGGDSSRDCSRVDCDPV